MKITKFKTLLLIALICGQVYYTCPAQGYYTPENSVQEKKNFHMAWR